MMISEQDVLLYKIIGGELTRFSWTGLTICHSHRLNGDCVPSRRAYPAKFFMFLRLR